jgi:hypothetical protein
MDNSAPLGKRIYSGLAAWCHDVAKPYKFRFDWAFPSEAAAQKAAIQLTSMGLQAQAFTAAQSFAICTDGWCVCRAWANYVLAATPEETFDTLGQRFHEVAKSFGGEFFDWFVSEAETVGQGLATTREADQQHRTVATIQTASGRIVAAEIQETCPDCGAAMKLRYGRKGYFLGCTRYPKCKGVAVTPKQLLNLLSEEGEIPF